jgi:hypothetical protein
MHHWNLSHPIVLKDDGEVLPEHPGILEMIDYTVIHVYHDQKPEQQQEPEEP